MRTRGTPAGTRARGGFTLLELMIVVAIIGVVMGLAAATMDEVGARGATQNAAADFFSALNRARSRALARGTEVYVVVFPTMKKDGSLTGGNGAWFLYEDVNGDFLKSAAAANDRKWSDFTPPNGVAPGAGSQDRLLESVYLENYPKQAVQFFKPAGSVTTLNFSAPFTAVGTAANANGCSFCGGTKGAIVFSGDRLARFISQGGTQVSGRVGGVALQGRRNPSQLRLFGVVSATGLVSALPPP